MIELTKQVIDRSGSIESSQVDILKNLMDLSIAISKSPKRFVKNYWLRNQDFLIDLSVKKDSLFDRVHHIVETYGRLNLKGSLP